MARLIKEGDTPTGGHKREYAVGYPTYIPKRRNPISDHERSEMDMQFKLLQQKMEDRRLASQGVADIKLFRHWIELNHNIDVSKPLSISGSTDYLMSMPVNITNLTKYMSKLDAMTFATSTLNSIIKKNNRVPLYAKYDNNDELTNDVVASLFEIELNDGQIKAYIKFDMGGNDKRKNGTMAKWLWLHPKYRSINFAIRENDSTEDAEGKKYPIIDGMYIDGRRIRNPDCIAIYRDDKVLYGEDFTLLIQDYHQRLVNAQEDLAHIEREIKRTSEYLKKYLKSEVLSKESIDNFCKVSGYGPLILSKILDEFSIYKNACSEQASQTKKINAIKHGYESVLKSYIAEEDEPYIEIFD